MQLTSQKAKALLTAAQKQTPDDRWIRHSMAVGDCAGIIAQALSDHGVKVDVDQAIALGYIHDIGKMFACHDGVLSHAVNGYQYLKSLGYDETATGICLKHSFLNHDIDCLANDRDATDRTDPHYDFVKNYIRSEYRLEEKIINLCDLMCTTEILTVEKRLIDLLLRHGVFAQTHYHLTETMQLKKYFDDLLGGNLYDLFPVIKDNL